MDFSSVRAPGEYYVQVDGVGRSYSFPIRDSIYCDLLRADSKGRYFHQHIRGKYPYQRIQNVTPTSRP